MVRAVGPVAVPSYDPVLRITFGLGWYGLAPLALKSLLIYENWYYKNVMEGMLRAELSERWPSSRRLSKGNMASFFPAASLN